MKAPKALDLRGELEMLVGKEPFEDIFIKKDGNERKMVCTMSPDTNNAVYGLVTVYEGEGDNAKAKSVNLNTLVSLRFPLGEETEPVTYIIEDEQWVHLT